MKDEKETLILNKYHTYDALIVVGTALVILGLIVFETVFTGVGSLGRASVIIGVLLFLVGGIMDGNFIDINKKEMEELLRKTNLMKLMTSTVITQKRKSLQKKLPIPQQMIL